MRKQKNITGSRIAEARLRHRPPLTQLEMSRRLQAGGVRLDRAAVAKIENGLRGILDYEILAIAGVLGVSVRHLLPKAGGKKPMGGLAGAAS